MSVLLFFLLFFQISTADALLRIVAPLGASEIESWIGHPRIAFFAASSGIVLEEFRGGVADGTADLKNVLFFPVACILSRTFHRLFIISLSPPHCNRSKVLKNRERTVKIYFRIHLIEK
jgi:hypothetical protein